MDILFLTITYAGGYNIIGLLTFLTIISFYLHRQRSLIVPIILSVGGSAISVYILKYLFDAPRPLGASLYLELTPSFPSGHAAFAIAFYGFLIYAIWSADHHVLKHKSILMLGLLIFAICISRLYLGVHYPIDVLFGFMIGLWWLLVGILVSPGSAR